MEKTTHVSGIHAVTTLLKANPQRIKILYIDRSRQDQKIQNILQLAENAAIKINMVSRAQLDQSYSGLVHQGIVAICEPIDNLGQKELSRDLEQIKTTPLILILDGIKDPHNLGACLRTALAAGVDMVIAPKDRAVGITTTVSKVACGGAELIPFYRVTNLARTLAMLKERGIWLYGTVIDADTTIYQADLSGATGLVLGAEDKGIRRLTKSYCDQLVKIPMQGDMTSLNVSVAAGICLFEALRQRH